MMLNSAWWDPMAELARFQREMNRLMDAFCQSSDLFPRVNAWADDNTVVVRAEVPGVDPASLKVSVASDVLTLEGERSEATPPNLREAHRQERAARTFSRSLRLPWEVEEGQVKAVQKNGVLTVTLPRRESTKPRPIAVTAE